jgi:rubredoxin
MSDSLNFNQPTSRRGFLRGSSLMVFSSVIAPRLVFGGQDTSPQGPSANAPEKSDKQEEGRTAPSTEQVPAQAQKPDEQDETKVTKKDENGNEYRVCPQCGNNMYRQDRTWTCENCGYSYTE